MGRVVVRTWSRKGVRRTANTIRHLKSHVETDHCKSFLKYIQIQKESRWR